MRISTTLFLALLSLPSFSFAQQFELIEASSSESRLERQQLTSLSGNNEDPLGWWPFLSANLGLLSFDEEAEGDGHNLQLKGVLSYYNPDRLWVFEGGLGVQNSQADDKDTTSGLIEGAARYRLTPKWEAGALSNFFVGSGSRYGSSNSDLTTFLGAQILTDIPLQNGHLLRAGARWMTDVGIPGEFANILMFEMHYGFPFEQQSRPVSQIQEERSLEQEFEEAPRSTHLARIAFERSEWSGPQLAYSTRQVDPNSTDRRKMSLLAQELLSRPELVEKIKVIGHADQRGSTYSNLMLSKARAQSVANALVLAGFPQEKVEVVAAGESQLLSSGNDPEAWQKNRRVEMEFEGVTDLKLLKELLAKAGVQNLDIK